MLDDEEHTRVIGSFVIIPKEEKIKADLKKQEKPVQGTVSRAMKKEAKKEEKPGQVSQEAAVDENREQVSQQGGTKDKPVPPPKPQLRSPLKPQRVTHAEPQRHAPSLTNSYSNRIRKVK